MPTWGVVSRVRRGLLRLLLGLLLGLLLDRAPAWAQGQLINGNRTLTGTLNAATTTGSANAYILTLNPAITAYVTNQCFTFRASFPNTASATLNVNGVGPKPLKKYASATQTDLVAGDITSGQIILTCYDGTTMQLVGAVGGSPVLSGAHVVTTQAETDLSTEANLGALTSGLLKHTVTGGVSTLGTSIPGTDHVVPGGNVATATALAANGTNCPPGQAPLGVDDVGNAESCTDVATQAELDTGLAAKQDTLTLAPVAHQFVVSSTAGVLGTARPTVADLTDGTDLVKLSTTQIIENKQLVPRVCEFAASSGTLTPNLDLCDKAYRHDVSGPVAMAPPTASGSNPRPMQALSLSLRAATEQPITWPPLYGDGYGVPLPATIPSSHYMALLFLWNVTSGKYELWAGDVTLTGGTATPTSSAAAHLYLHAIMGGS